jgi:hypothetical protein
MQELEKLIKMAKCDDEVAMLQIIDTFKPLIYKYYTESHYDTDMRNEMILKLIKFVKSEIKLEKMRVKNDYVLIDYIDKSMWHHYISISKKNNSIKSMETYLENELMFDYTPTNESVSEYELLDIETIESLRVLLTKKEFQCINFTVFMGYTSAETAKILNTTKQACNQCKQRAFEKIRNYYVSMSKV